MRRTQAFEFVQPTSLKEANAIMLERGSGGHFIAGGTDLVIAIKERGLSPQYVVDLKHISDLSGIEENKVGEITIGALTTLYDIEKSNLILERYHFLAQSAAEIGSTQIRHRGTLGGNLVNASPSADAVPCLLALDAKVCISNGTEEKIIELDDFFLGPGKTVMKAGEILTQILIPPTHQGHTGEYYKCSPRHQMDLASVGVAVAMNLSKEKKCDTARIALGAVAPVPLRAKKAEALLEGQILTEQLAEQVAKQASMECKPIGDVRSTAAFRTEMVRVLTKRTLLNAAARKDTHLWGERRKKHY